MPLSITATPTEDDAQIDATIEKQHYAFNQGNEKGNENYSRELNLPFRDDVRRQQY